MENEINKLKEGKFGKVTNIFKIQEIVSGSKKAPQEPHAVKDAKTNELVVASTEIKRVTLNNCMHTFKHNHSHDDVEALVSLVNSVHDKIMVKGEEDPFEITEDDFEDIVKKLEKKNKIIYDFLIKTGKQFKLVVFKLCRRLIESEQFPSRFFTPTVEKEVPKGRFGKP